MKWRVASISPIVLLMNRLFLPFSFVALCGAISTLSCSDSGEAEDTGEAASDDDDDDADDDDGADDDDDGPTVIEGPDGGTFEVIFSGEGIDCGDDSCLNADLGDFSFPGCCADEAASSCGLDLSGIGVLIGLVAPGCEPLNLPGAEDESCEESPPLEAAIPDVNGTVLPGCCQQSGQCGYFASLQGIGFGCVSPTRFGFDEGGDCDFEP